MAKIGDRVRFLNSVGGGVVKKIEGNIAYVDEDGFETPVLLREVVVVQQAGEMEKPKAADVKPTVRAEEPVKPTAPSSEPAPTDKLNVMLAYEPREIKHLNTTTFDTYLVNDSNYFLYFTYMTRADEAKGWTARYAGVVEPGIQLFLEEIEGTDLPEMDRVAVQLIAFKEGKEFQIKSPVAVEMPLDTKKFFKIHCFHSSIYFDGEVIEIPIVVNDVPHRRMVIDSSRLEEGIKAKKAVDRPKSRPIERKPKKPGVLEIDLHASELVDTTAGLSPADLLNLQIDEFRRVMDENMRNKGLKIVFIHGKGEGVLRNALMKELNHRYKGHQVQDASFREYGFGATQVTI